jgi:hypothetical protein
LAKTAPKGDVDPLDGEKPPSTDTPDGIGD